MIKVYCHNMRYSTPREYLNLSERENYSMVYGYQLKNHTECPAQITQNDLKISPNTKAGKTYYKYVHHQWCFKIVDWIRSQSRAHFGLQAYYS